MFNSWKIKIISTFKVDNVIGGCRTNPAIKIKLFFVNLF